jgi:hypothetical protein
MFGEIGEIDEIDEIGEIDPQSPQSPQSRQPFPHHEAPATHTPHHPTPPHCGHSATSNGAAMARKVGIAQACLRSVGAANLKVVAANFEFENEREVKNEFRAALPYRP